MIPKIKMFLFQIVRLTSPIVKTNSLAIMKNLMKPLIFIFSILLLITVLSPVARADSAFQRAIASAEALQEDAAVSVAAARDRVAEAESTLRIVHAAADYASHANDRKAMDVAAKAVAKAELNLREAEQLLTRAKMLLVARGQTLELLRKKASYRHQPRGLLGGTTWDSGTYVRNLPLTLTPEKRAKEDKDLREKLEKAGVSSTRFSTLKDYDFILGIAISTNALVDIGLRVAFDQLSKGHASAELQSGYNLLRERSFDVLDCHSNGAMICLAALSNGDVTAKKVRLMGPQITTEALQEWGELLKVGKTGNGIEQLEILINNHDQVPTISYLTPTKIGPGGALVFIASGVAASVLPVLEKNLQDAIGNKSVFDMFIDHQIREVIPNVIVKRLDCNYGGIYKWVEKCHDFDAYPSQQNPP